MLTLSPINKDIRETLDKKSAMLNVGAGRNIYKDTDGKWGMNSINTPVTEKGRIQKNYMFSRTPFLRMTSTVPKNNLEAVILMGGELDRLGKLRSGMYNREIEVNAEVPSMHGKLNYKGLYNQSTSGLSGTALREFEYLNPQLISTDSIPYRPIAGVKDISIEYKGGGMRLGSTRTAEISWTCWTWQELENYRPHFLHHGIHILLEWGWTAPGIDFSTTEPFYDLWDEDIYVAKFKQDKLDNIHEKLLDHTLKQKGNYDAMLGLIQDFTWSVNEDGGFDCTTKIISQGVILLQKLQKSNMVQRAAKLPLFANQTANPANTFFRSMWTADDTIIDYSIGDEGAEITVENIAPYISIQEYMSDFPIQIWSYLNDIDAIQYNPVKGPVHSTRLTGASHIATHGMKVFRIESLNADGGDWTFGRSESGISMTNGFVTWGWFEDNVLSRFFGTVQGDKLIGEFRSIEPVLDDVGNLVKMDKADVDKENGRFRDAKEGQQIYESTKMTNSKYLMTVDSAKWLIPNLNDPFFQHMNLYKSRSYRKSTGAAVAGDPILEPHLGIFHPLARDGPTDTNGQPDEDNQFYRLKKNRFSKIAEYPYDSAKLLFKGGGSTIGSIKATVEEKRRRMKVQDEGTDEKNIRSGYIRNIYFNCNYLKEKFESSGDIVHSVMSVWEDFSTEYGGVYKFKVEFADDGKRAMVVEEGFTGQSVGDTLENEDKRKMVYKFPAFSNDSFIKSQNISAKIPKRMQLAAMYGKVSKPDNPDAEVNHSVNDGYEDLVAKSWGNFVEPIPSDPTGLSDDEIKQKRYDDMMGGKIDFPSRKNRYFGQVMADPNEPISIGKFDDEGKGKAVKGDGKGIQIQDTILNEVMNIQKNELYETLAALEGVEVDSKELEKIISTEKLPDKEVQLRIFEKLSAYKSTPETAGYDIKWWKFYDMKETAELLGTPRLKKTFQWALQSMLRGNTDGVLKQIDPLIPIEFEMEIDGIGGIFPGNSFHSSYLPQRYKDESLFQAIGVSHKIDINGWTTTIKGQIRARSIASTQEFIYGVGSAPANPLYDEDAIMNDPNLTEEEKLAKIAELRASGFVSSKTTYAFATARQMVRMQKEADKEFTSDLSVENLVDLGRYVGSEQAGMKSAAEANKLYLEQLGPVGGSFIFDGVLYTAAPPSQFGFGVSEALSNFPTAGQDLSLLVQNTFGYGEPGTNFHGTIGQMATAMGVSESTITNNLMARYNWNGDPALVQAGWTFPR